MSAFPFFIGGMLLLLLAGDILAELTMALARRLRFRPITIALTLTALATSMPEIFVSAIAAVEGAPALALGNVAGSNISNHWLVLGLAALLAPLTTTTPLLRRNGFFALTATTLAALLATAGGLLSRADGFLLLFASFLWFAYSLHVGRDQPHLEEAPGAPAYRFITCAVSHPAIAGLFFLATVLGLGIGAHLALEGAKGMARFFSLPDAVIGLTALAVGTSLPELATSLAAARRNHGEVILGNLLGSTVLNCFVVLGFAALLHPIPVEAQFIRVHFPLAVLACFSLLPFLLLRRNVGRVAGGVYLALYAGYIFHIF